MDASFKSDVHVVCPYCKNKGFSVVRRRIDDNEMLVKTCRCEACGDQFEITVDEEGSPIRYSDNDKSA